MTKGASVVLGLGIDGESRIAHDFVVLPWNKPRIRLEAGFPDDVVGLTLLGLLTLKLGSRRDPAKLT